MSLSEGLRVAANVKKVTDTKLVQDSARLEVLAVAQTEARSAVLFSVPTSSPRPISKARCPAGAVRDAIDATFGNAAPWAESVSVRESHCTFAVNQHEGCDTSGRTDSRAMGPAQICLPLHAAAFSAVGCDWTNWRDIGCYMRAWKYLYDTEGIGPWRI